MKEIKQVQRELQSLLDRKYATQYIMQLAEQRYVSRNVWSVESGDEVANLEPRSDARCYHAEFGLGNALSDKGLLN